MDSCSYPPFEFTMAERDPHSAIARRHLDEALAEFRTVLSSAPAGSWIRTLRSALGMSSADLASRMGITPSAVRQFESSEQAGTIQLGTLQRVADALDADLMYAIVPRTSLEQMVEAQALAVARRELDDANHTMGLEGQRPAGGRDDEWIRMRASELRDSSRLWSKPA